jgi:dTDP-4-dehydrorhamnose reductase
MQQLARERDGLQTGNKTGFPTFTTDVAQEIDRLIKTDRRGLCQMVGCGSANRHKLTREILELRA